MFEKTQNIFFAAADNFRSELKDLREVYQDFSKQSAGSPFARSKKLFLHLLSEHQSPQKLAAATFLGVVIGVSPWYGLHLFICLLSAMIFRLNKVFTYLVACISIPPIAPFIIFASYELGFFLFQGEFFAFDGGGVPQEISGIFLYLIVGSLALGLVVGIPAAAFVFFVAHFAQRKSQVATDHFEQALQLIRDAFMPMGKFAAGFASGKLKFDPIYRELLHLIPKDASILDVGGGQGLLCILHDSHHRGNGKKTVLDWDEKKLHAGRHAAATLGLNIEFVAVDVFADHFALSSYDYVCCIDMLHYNPAGDQKRLLTRLADKMQAHSVLIIRDMDADQKFRTFLTLLQERFSLFFGLSKAKKLFPPSARQLSSTLCDLGFVIEICKPCWGYSPFSNTLTIARKSAP